jgi:hypothetical protein
VDDIYPIEESTATIFSAEDYAKQETNNRQMTSGEDFNNRYLS